MAHDTSPFFIDLDWAPGYRFPGTKGGILGAVRVRHLLAVLAAAATLLAAVAAGAVWGFSSSWPEDTYKNVKFAVREAAGLPKFWQPVPGMTGNHVKVPCPNAADTLVIATGGQSNAANSNTSLSGTTPDQHAYDWYAGACYIAQDPVPGASGTMGSLWPTIGADLARRLNRPVLMIHGAIGGSQVADWLDPRSGYYAGLGSQIDGARAAGFEPSLVIWHQGETDASRNPTLDDIAFDFGGLTDRLLTDLPTARMYLFQASKCTGHIRRHGLPAVRDAQRLVAESRSRVVAGLDTDALGDDYRWDSCHFNSLGRDAIRKQLVPELAALLAHG